MTHTVYQRVTGVLAWFVIGSFALCFLLMLVPAARESGLFVAAFNVMMSALGVHRLITFVHDDVLRR